MAPDYAKYYIRSQGGLRAVPQFFLLSLLCPRRYGALALGSCRHANR